MNALELNQVGKTFETSNGTREVLRQVNLHVPEGEFTCVVGSSGVGKTTFMRCIAGLTPPTEGEVRVLGNPVCGPSESMAVVFQDYSRSLMPWLTIQRNVELPLLDKGIARDERRRRVESALRAVGLADVPALHPWQLSGGMQQRVAIARAIAYQPAILLMDEPFGALDAQTRAELQDVTRALQHDLGVTTVFITHDIDEAIYLGNRVVVLGGRPGRIVKVLDVPFGRDRDQAVTKADRQFGVLREELLATIKK